MVASFGSAISVVSLFCFIWVFYKGLIEAEGVAKRNYFTPPFCEKGCAVEKYSQCLAYAQAVENPVVYLL